MQTTNNAATRPSKQFKRCHVATLPKSVVAKMLFAPKWYCVLHHCLFDNFEFSLHPVACYPELDYMVEVRCVATMGGGKAIAEAAFGRLLMEALSLTDTFVCKQ